jgi:hypothetical protein
MNFLKNKKFIIADFWYLIKIKLVLVNRHHTYYIKGTEAHLDTYHINKDKHAKYNIKYLFCISNIFLILSLY